MPTRAKSRSDTDFSLSETPLSDAIDKLAETLPVLGDLSESLEGLSYFEEGLDCLQANIGLLVDAHMLASIAQFGSEKDREWAVGELKWRYETQFGEVLIPRPAKPPGLKIRS